LQLETMKETLLLKLQLTLSNVYKLCDKAVSKGILHKNTAARKKSRLTIAINKLKASK